MDTLTEKQRAILEFVNQYIAVAHYAPTYREIAEMLGIRSKNTVHHHLTALQEAGYVTWRPGRVRTLRVIRNQNGGN